MTIHKIKRYIKQAKPVNAMQIYADNLESLGQWIEGCATQGEKVAVAKTTNPDGWCIGLFSVSGTMYGRPGDWVIQGVLGEFYICPHDVFAASYEEEK